MFVTTVRLKNAGLSKKVKSLSHLYALAATRAIRSSLITICPCFQISSMLKYRKRPKVCLKEKLHKPFTCVPTKTLLTRSDLVTESKSLVCSVLWVFV